MSGAEQRIDPVVAGVRMQWGVRIPMRDGVQLNATLYLPPSQVAPKPALFTLTPYIGQTYHDIGLYFAAHGFPFLLVDVRGRGNSEGSFRPLINEGKDACDIVEWLAGQSYCDGQVSMWGGSYGGYVQWATAARAPPHLATIVPVAAPFIGVDFPIRNNIGAPYWMQWLTLVAGRTSQDKMFWNSARFWGALFRRWFESGAPFTALDTQIGNPSTAFQEWTAHPQQDSYWDSYNPTPEQYARLRIPILTVTGSYDGDQLGALAHYRNHLQSSSASRAQHYLIIGPWDHSGTRAPQAEFCGLKVGPASLLDLPRLHLEWYRWTMLGAAKPAFLRKNVAYYMMGAEEWRYAETLDEVTARSEPLYVHSDANPTDVFRSGSLLPAPAPAASGPDHYVYDPRDVSLAELESGVDPENRADQRMLYAATGRQLIYHSAPFGSDVEVAGFFKLCVWLAIDQPDTDFRAWVYEVAVDGSAVLLSVDSMRARYRSSLRTPTLVMTCEPLRYDFGQFMFVARRVRKHSRLRLVIGPINSIYSQKNHNSGGPVPAESIEDARVVTVSLYHDAQRPSALYVPFARPSA